MEKRHTFESYLSNLSKLTPHVSPLNSTDETDVIRELTGNLESIGSKSLAELALWIQQHPEGVRVLALIVGLSQEKLKNSLRNEFDTTGWNSLARTRPVEVIQWLEKEFDLSHHLEEQLYKTFTLSDVLVARAGTRAYASRAGASGRSLEDEIENIACELGLPYEARTRFIGRSGRTAPCDLSIPGGAESAMIVIAAKGFDSTGSKLTDAVREIEEMAEVRRPNQFVMAVIDGIGWKSRKRDLSRIHQLYSQGAIDGMYTVNTLQDFKVDLQNAVKRLGLEHLQNPENQSG